MVPVEEDQRLLAQDYEHRVAELRDLGQDEHPRPESGDFVCFDEAGKEEELLLIIRCYGHRVKLGLEEAASLYG